MLYFCYSLLWLSLKAGPFHHCLVSHLVITPHFIQTHKGWASQEVLPFSYLSVLVRLLKLFLWYCKHFYYEQQAQQRQWYRLFCYEKHQEWEWAFMFLDTHLGLVLLGQRVGGHSPKVHTCKTTSKIHYPNINSISYFIFVNYFIIANTWHFLPLYLVILMALPWHGVTVLIWTLG